MASFRPLFPKKESVPKPDVDQMIRETRQQLFILEDRYRTILTRELMYGRENARKGKKDAGNYSRIGIAYYTLNIVKAAQDRVMGIESTRDLTTAIEATTNAVGMINTLSQRAGGLDVSNLIKKVKKNLKGGSSGGGSDLQNAFTALSGLDLADTSSMPISSMVSNEIIDQLISGTRKVDDCLREEAGFAFSSNDIMDAVAQANAEQAVEKRSGKKQPEMAEIDDLINSLKNL